MGYKDEVQEGMNFAYVAARGGNLDEANFGIGIAILAMLDHLEERLDAIEAKVNRGPSVIGETNATF